MEREPLTMQNTVRDPTVRKELRTYFVVLWLYVEIVPLYNVYLGA